MNMERVTPNENEEYDPDTIVWDGEESEEELGGNEEYVDRGEWEEDIPVMSEHETNEEQQWQESEIHMEDEEEEEGGADNDEAEVPLINRRQERGKATKRSNLNQQASVNSTPVGRPKRRRVLSQGAAESGVACAIHKMLQH